MESFPEGSSCATKDGGNLQQGMAAGAFRRDLDPRIATLCLLGPGNSTALWFGREPGVTLERITSI